MDYRIETRSGMGEMTFEMSTDMNLLNNIYLSLMVTRGTFFARPGFGCRRLDRAKNIVSNADLMHDYCREALQWLIDCGRAKSFAITVERDPRDDPHRLRILVVATKADLTAVSFETYLEVV
jgi:phage gp46-like protein